MTSVRKFYLTLFACSFLTFSAVAQLSLGLRGGINVAEYSFKDNGTNLDQESITGFTFGGLLEIGLGGNIFLQPEFIYTQKGSQLEVLNEENKFNVNYLDIPVLLKIKIINADLFNLNLLGGPSFGLALNGEESRAGQTVDINFGGENGLKQFDLGLQAGGGVGINLGDSSIFGDVRYLFGVSNISEDNDREIKNKGLNFSVGLMFRIFG